MIRAEFSRRDGQLFSVKVKGHAGYANSGEDIVCASVSSAVQLTANGITECVHDKAEICVDQDMISVALGAHPSEMSLCFMNALHLQLTCLEQDFQGFIKVTVSEV